MIAITVTTPTVIAITAIAAIHDTFFTPRNATPRARNSPLTSMNFPRLLRLGALLFLLVGGAPFARAQDTQSQEGSDLVIGGPGTAPGQFLELRDIAFDAKGQLYALDGARLNPQTKAREGNLRVQKFDHNTGQLLQTFDLRDAATSLNLGERNNPRRVAADALGHVYVTQTHAGKVLVLGADGKFLRALDISNAKAITVANVGGQERVVVAPEDYRVVNGAYKQLDGDKLLVLRPGGIGVEKTIELPQAYRDVEDLSSDDAGNFYIKAAPNAIYKVSPQGGLLKMWGGNSDKNGRAEDGSQLVHTVAVDKAGHVYTLTWGNPGKITRFDAGGKTVTQRDGQFQWADPWSGNSSYTPLAVDPTTNRLWVGATQRYAPDYVHLQRQRAVPAIVRADADFFADDKKAKRTPTYKIGFRATLSSDLLYNIAYETGAPIAMQLDVSAATRSVDRARVNWRVYDALKTEVGAGRSELTLRNGEAATAQWSWIAPRYGAYFVVAEVEAVRGELVSLGNNIAVTPHFAGVKELVAGERTGTATTDAAAQMWAGLANVRLYAHLAKAPDKGKRLDELDGQISAAQKNGALVLMQLVDSQKDYNADDLRLLLNRFKGRIHYLEVCNEPNFSGSIEDYYKIHREAYGIVKASDPSILVMGPSTVEVNLGWAKKLYELGFARVSDVYSVHDYEGHESISPEHWQWKFGELRKIMAQSGDGDKPIWQTERAIHSVRGRNFQGLVQAIRLPLHLDTLETLGVPAERDLHFYLNQSGFSDVPSYVWSNDGPLPAALATRVRYALTRARGRDFAGTLDFGREGNALFQGVRFAGAGGETLALRNLGTLPTPLPFRVSGANSLRVTDAWGNAAPVVVAGGTATLTLGQLPIYVDLPLGATLTAPRLELGTNVAARATFAFSAPLGQNKENFATDIKLLNNSVLETYHNANPKGDADGRKLWAGAMPRAADGSLIPQILEMSFPNPQRLSAVVLRGVRADNAFSALLDYDLEYQDAAGSWKNLARVRNSPPPSERVSSADADYAIWTDDTNFYLHRFAPITTAKLRLRVLNVSRGFLPDDGARAWGYEMTPYFMLREVELFGPNA